MDIELTQAEFIWLNKTITGIRYGYPEDMGSWSYLICMADVIKRSHDQMGDVVTAESAAGKLMALAKGLEEGKR